MYEVYVHSTIYVQVCTSYYTYTSPYGGYALVAGLQFALVAWSWGRADLRNSDAAARSVIAFTAIVYVGANVGPGSLQLNPLVVFVGQSFHGAVRGELWVFCVPIAP